MTAFAEGTILSTVRNGVATLALNRPDAINAINDAIRTGLPEAVHTVDQNPGVRAIVIRGNGPRGFCVGADVKEPRPPETLVQARQRLSRNDWIAAVAAAEKPVIVAIHGFCLGAGLELALAGDVRMASRDAELGLPEDCAGADPRRRGNPAPAALDR
jgi:enoyl-CoA hydratase/carnithine racemase